MKKIVYLIFGIIYLLVAAFFLSFGQYIYPGFGQILFVLILLAPLIILGVCFLLFFSGKKEINKKSDRSLKNGMWALGAFIVLPIIFSLTSAAFLTRHFPIENQLQAIDISVVSLVWAALGLLMGFIWVIISLIFALLAIFKNQ